MGDGGMDCRRMQCQCQMSHYVRLNLIHAKSDPGGGGGVLSLAYCINSCPWVSIAVYQIWRDFDLI